MSLKFYILIFLLLSVFISTHNIISECEDKDDACVKGSNNYRCKYDEFIRSRAFFFLFLFIFLNSNF